MENKLIICDSDYSLETYFEIDKISEKTQDKLNKVDILAAPTLYSDGEYYFAQETIDFLKFCRSSCSDYSADILADGEIRVRELRSFDIWMPIIFVASSMLLPFVINMVSNYIWEKMKGREHENAKVSVTLLVKSGDAQKEFHYNGDAKTFKETFEKIDINKMCE